MIRRVGAGEAGRLADLHAAAFAEPWSEVALIELIADPHVTALANEDGFILVRAVAGEAEILTLAVAPAARQQGLGRRLVEAGADAAAAAGAEALFLEVAVDNVAAIALYDAAGFAPAGRRRAYYRRPDGSAVDALVLRKLLTPSTA